MLRRAALVFVAACSGGTGIEAPREKPVLRLVECTPAQPLLVEVDGRVTTHGRLDGARMRWAGGEGDRPKRAASISMGMPSTSGMLDTMAVRKAVTAKLTDLSRCYDRELAVNPSATRRSVAWRFSVAQDGRVLFANPTSGVLMSATNQCVSAVFRTMTFPNRRRGGTVTVTLPLVFDAIPIPERPQPAVTAGGEPLAWTPYAIGAFPPERATTLARAAESALRRKASQLEACFAKDRSGVRGSLRAVIGVEGDGDVAVTRAGGLGHAAAERCVEKELVGVKIVNPGRNPAEITCDFARGDAQPWRVSPTTRYELITATRKELRSGKQSVVVGADEPEPLPADATYLIVADPDTPGSVLTNALAWASEGEATLVTLRDGKHAPIYVGMGKFGHDDAIDSRPMLLLGRRGVRACLGSQSQQGKLAEAGQLAMRLAKRCRSMRCGSLVVGIDDLAVARDLVEISGAARRAGFDRVLIGGALDCEPLDFDEDAER